jgi:glycerophosphoryl diester phosphodiesterase
VDLIELDVHLSADGELMVIHDETIDRTTNGKGRKPILSIGTETI